MQTYRNQLVRAARLFIALLAAMVLVLKLYAQSAQPPVDSRFLLIFDTSAAMKPRLPAVQIAIDSLLATSMREQLHAGDSIGVWTFDRELRTGQFPLQHWDPVRAAAVAADIKDFLHGQHYANKTSFDALQPYLNQVVQNSERLTVMIFCDGLNETKWTPYDKAINEIFKLRQAERKKLHQPFILLLRSQRGQYIGCTIGFPPELVGFPEFPPLPAPKIKPVSTNAPAVPASLPPAPILPSLVIIGTNVGTNMPPTATQEQQPVATNVPVVAPTVSNVVASVSSNLPPPAEIKPVPPVALPLPTNPPQLAPTPQPAPEILPAPPAIPLPPTNEPPTPPTKAIAEPAVAPTGTVSEIPAVVPTNAVTPPMEKSDTDSRNLLLIGGGLLVAAVALVAFLLFRPRRADRTSLITRSMNQGLRPPPKN